MRGGNISRLHIDITPIFVATSLCLPESNQFDQGRLGEYALDRHQLLLTLAHMPGTQYDRILTILAEAEGTELLLNANRQQLRELGFTENNARFMSAIGPKLPPITETWLQHPAHHFINYFDSAYPALLRETAGAPLGLFVAGKPEVLQQAQIAIVGGRKATPASKALSYEIARDLVAAGYVVTSGLAQGIDAMAHQGALDTTGQKTSEHATVAVLGHGLDTVYPQRHKRLATQVMEQGALVSEFVPGTEIRPHHFPRRNRIISGMSVACIVVEAASKSGSLITARCALEQNREVFAVPGAVGNRQARGSNQLIKEGAMLIENAQDVIENLNGFQTHAVAPTEALIGSNQQANGEDSLLSQIGFEIISFDALLGQSDHTVESLNAALLDLEIDGKITCVAGGYIRN